MFYVAVGRVTVAV